MTLAELQAKNVSLRAQAKTLVETATKEKRELTSEERTKFDGLKSDIETVKGDIDRMAFIDGENRSLAANPNAQIDPEADQGHNPLGVPEKDLRNYSVLRAVRCLVKNKRVDGLEGEISQEIAKRSGKDATGFYVYGSATSAIESRAASDRESRALAQREYRTDLNTTTGTGGINTVVLFQSFIEKLRNKTVIDKCGVRFMAGLQGKFYIPRQSGAGTAYWVGEATAPTTSNQTIDQVALAPTTLGAFTDVSRQFIEQTSLDAEAFVRDDLAKVMAIEIDRAALHGDGSSNSPQGIAHIPGITHTVLAAALAWADAVGMETTVATANADEGTLAYVTNNKVRGALKTTLRSAVAGAKYIWDDDNTINSYKAFATNNVDSTIGLGDTEGAGTGSRIIFGNWNSLIVGMWGGLDIMVDPYSLSTKGSVRIVALQDTDIKVRHNESFVTLDDVTA